MPDTCYEKTENWCSKSVTVPIYILLYHSDQQTDLTKLPEKYNCSALPIFLAINRSIYYLLNGTFSQAYDVNHLIKRLLLMFRQYITRRNDFKFLWFALLLTGILRSRHISLWFIFVLYLRIHIVPWKLFWFQKKNYVVNLLTAYTMNLTINKFVILRSCLHFISFGLCIKFVARHNPLSLPVSDRIIKSTTSFIGGGRSARIDYGFLKPYMMSTEFQLKFPHDFSYVYGSHRTFDNAIQEIQTSGEAQLVCNIPLALVANILTSIQANEVAKEHNLHVSRKSLAEKRTSIESHVCTMSCNPCVTMFKPVKKKPEDYQV
jgi:hypothetical protein